MASVFVTIFSAFGWSTLGVLCFLVAVGVILLALK